MSCTRRRGSGCAACVDACPKAALTAPDADEPPRLDSAACVGCGLCVPACPVGALTDVGPDPSEVAERVAAAGTCHAVVRCQVAQQVGAPGHAAAVLVPCLASIDPETLAASAARLGKGTITLERGTCEACPIASVGHVARALRAGAALAASVAPEVSLSDRLLVPDESGGSPAHARGRPRSRRSLFRPPAPNAPRQEAASPRSVLLAVAPDAPLPRPEISALCTGCEACGRVCPTGALRWMDSPAGATAVFDPRACVDCGECTRVCVEAAITVTGRSTGPHRAVVLATIDQGRCSRCRAVLAPGEDGTCSRCRGRRGMLDAVWATLG